MLSYEQTCCVNCSITACADPTLDFCLTINLCNTSTTDGNYSRSYKAIHLRLGELRTFNCSETVHFGDHLPYSL